MTTFRVLLLLCLVVCSLSELIQLTDENFEEKFAEKDWLVKFYAPWCKHCKTLKPVFEELASKVSHAGIGEIDATKNKVTAEKYGVKSYPTIIYKQDGVVGKYDGHRSMAGLTAFLDRLNAPACIDVKNISEMKEHSAFSAGVSFVLVLSPAAADPEQVNIIRTTFKDVSVKLKQHASFGILEVDLVTDADSNLLSKYGPIALLKVEEGREPRQMPSLSDTTSFVDIEKIVEENNYPLISKYDNHNFKRLSHIPGKFLVCAVVDYNRPETATILTALEQVLAPATSKLSSEERERFIFGHLDGVKWRNFIKHHRTMVPALLILDQANDLHQTFPLSPSASTTAIASSASADTPTTLTLHDQMTAIMLEMVDSVNKKDNWKTGDTPGLFEKLSYRFKSYYPYSLMVVALPLLFFLGAMMTPFPEEKKGKKD
eukprot:CAMPEP_0170404286 /NCGR_PEP_ID=MMETSP0117_2-20130122/26550_1 /TAXON_ID=400756 /ORGANISM="Durinskia baltica, Strain CSIRO CS-38" /LENGTH=429 /DNA_ID=CAMNT_0010661291 /DNA_START=13 /DNA_END=1302 /DNA_ORIENTATION=-